MRNPRYILYLIPNVVGVSQAVALLAMIIAFAMFIVFAVKNKKKQVD
jgi:uncharacterized membrane protein YhaH (DUF805 family)